MPLEQVRLRAVDALRSLRTAESIGASAELLVDPVCQALHAVRELLLAYEESIARVAPHLDHKAAELRAFAEQLPPLVSALELVTTAPATHPAQKDAVREVLAEHLPDVVTTLEVVATAPVRHPNEVDAVLQVFAVQLPELVMALEIVSSRSASILKLSAHGSDPGPDWG